MRLKQRFGIAATVAGTLAVGAVAATSASAHKATTASSSLKGQTINVAIAYPAPKADLAKFTAETGIKVNWDYVQWDALQTKIAAAAEAHSYFADVADVDWSKVGEYYATKWFMPLNKYFPLCEREVAVPAGAGVHPQRRADGHADGRLAAGHDHQREGPQGGRRHQGPDDAHPVRDRPQGDRRQDHRSSTRSTSRSPRPKASRPTGTR